MTVPLSHSVSSEPFKYIAGDPALDLVNTVDWTGRGLEDDRLTDYDRLTRWGEGVGILSPGSAAHLRKRARTRPREAEAALRGALQTRWVLRRTFEAIASGTPSGDVLAELNTLLAQALPRLQVGTAQRRPGRGGVLELGWREMGTKLDSVLWPVLWSAASLLVSGEAGRIRICRGANCGWMYVDRSRNGLRRWCEMETCGTREKSRRRYQRQKKGMSG
jgi:predicted RNA-binding Zn ribbon-like protein